MKEGLSLRSARHSSSRRYAKDGGLRNDEETSLFQHSLLVKHVKNVSRPWLPSGCDLLTLRGRTPRGNGEIQAKTRQVRHSASTALA